jgi:hypothetical protein
MRLLNKNKMKAISNKLMLLVVVLMWSVACTNDETKVLYLGGTAPVLGVSDTSTLVLAKANENYTSLQFQWTNPSYQFSNGASTQDVFYTLQIDTTGSNFTNPKISELAYTNQLFNTFTVKDLNNALGGLELHDYKPHHFEFRVKATMASKSEPVYSNVLKIRITTYLDVVYPVPANLYIVGDATPSGWTNDSSHPDATQTFTKVNSYTFQINSLAILPNQFLFIPVAGSWSHKYAFDAPSASNSVDGDSFKPDAASNFQAPAAGNYKIVVNFKTGKYSMTKL